MPNNTPSKCPKLIVIPIREWGILRDMYRLDWPRHIISCYTIQNYIRWAAKNPNIQGVQILTTDNDWQEHGTFLLEDRDTKQYNVHFNTLRSDKVKTLMAALMCLDKRVTLVAYVERLRPMAEEYLNKLGVGNFHNDNTGYLPTVLYYLPKAKSRELSINQVPGYVVKSLNLQHVQLVNDQWPHHYPGSDYLIHRIISYNLAYGVFQANSNVMAGWVMQSEYGAVGMLHVDQAHRRQGLGEYLVSILCIKLAEMGMDAIASVKDNNRPSQRLFETLGFEEIDRAYWYDKMALDELRIGKAKM